MENPLCISLDLAARGPGPTRQSPNKVRRAGGDSARSVRHPLALPAWTWRVCPIRPNMAPFDKLGGQEEVSRWSYKGGIMGMRLFVHGARANDLGKSPLLQNLFQGREVIYVADPAHEAP